MVLHFRTPHPNKLLAMARAIVEETNAPDQEPPSARSLAVAERLRQAAQKAEKAVLQRSKPGVLDLPLMELPAVTPG